MKLCVWQRRRAGFNGVRSGKPESGKVKKPESRIVGSQKVGKCGTRKAVKVGVESRKCEGPKSAGE
ncbi:hypothetical protein D3C75_1256710 [compost metagenome]